MASLLTDSEISSFGEAINSHFDTFSRQIIINKEPQKTIISTNVITNPTYVGYGPTSQPLTNITYTPVSGIYSGILIYNRDQSLVYLNDVRVALPKGEVKLKVKPEAYNYIEAGKTENIAVDGLLFNILSNAAIQNYLGQVYYYYKVIQTN